MHAPALLDNEAPASEPFSSRRYVLDKLRKERPDVHAAVKSGEMTLPRAIVEAFGCGCEGT